MSSEKTVMQQNPRTYQGKIIAIDLMKSCFTILVDNQKTCTLPLNAWQEPFDIQIGDEVEFGKNEQGAWVRLRNTSDTSLLHNADTHQVGFSQLIQQSSQHEKPNQQFEKSDFHNTQFQEKETLYDNHVREVIEYPYGFFGSYLYTWKRCFDYKGRSRRKEYWYFCLMVIIMLLISMTIIVPLSFMFAGINSNYDYQFEDNFMLALGVLMLISFGMLSLIHTLPMISLNIRRFHDIGMSGWWSLLCYVPYIGVLASMFASFKGSELEENDWGSPVK